MWYGNSITSLMMMTDDDDPEWTANHKVKNKIKECATDYGGRPSTVLYCTVRNLLYIRTVCYTVYTTCTVLYTVQYSSQLDVYTVLYVT